MAAHDLVLRPAQQTVSREREDGSTIASTRTYHRQDKIPLHLEQDVLAISGISNVEEQEEDIVVKCLTTTAQTHDQDHLMVYMSTDNIPKDHIVEIES